MPRLPSFVEPLAHGVNVIDTGFERPRFDASYLIVESGRAAFVDTGTNHAVARLLASLEALGVARDAVDFVIATHVHLDHAGGAGALLQHLPRARLVVHPLGARHLIDPSRLSASARAVYGDEVMARAYGELVGVPAQRVLESHDGMTLDLAGRLLQFFDTPGHARHHHCVWDERSLGFFSGDTFGVGYPEFADAHRAWLIPTTPPTQFEPDVLCASVRRLLGFAPELMYLTHYGAVADVPLHGARLLEQIDAIVRLGEALREAPQRVDALKQGLAALYRGWLRDARCPLDETRALQLLAIDIELNAQGMDIWLG
jgi:glyoxylase-like metal-dependent hydrolase (beta-lactamase superfamily II)